MPPKKKRKEPFPRPSSEVPWKFKADFLLTQLTFDIMDKGYGRLSDHEWIKDEEKAFKAVVRRAAKEGCSGLMVDFLVDPETGEKHLQFSASDKTGDEA